MARLYSRRRPRRMGGVSRRQLNIVRFHTTGSVPPGAGGMTFADLLETAQDEETYKKDLTPATVTGVKGSYTWWMPAASGVAQAGRFGVGIREDSRRQIADLSETNANAWGRQSPLDLVGRYQRWHLWHVNHAIEPDESGYNLAQQAADNRRFFSIKSNRKMHTVDDSYFLFLDTADLQEDLHYSFECTIFLREP